MPGRLVSKIFANRDKLNGYQARPSGKLGSKPNFDCVGGGPSSENSFTWCGNHTVQLQSRLFFGGLTHDHLPFFLLLHREWQIADV
jgi:hypothetical protein